MDLIYRYDPFEPLMVRSLPDASSALRTLRDGHERFAEIIAQMHLHTLGEGDPAPIVIPFSPFSMGLPLVSGTESKQAPFALVVGCSDARVPTETIFDASFNDLFVVRIAGNALGGEGLGSIHYAVKHLGHSLKVLVVMGHTGCGAVTAAVDAYLSPEKYLEIAFTSALRSVVDHVQVAIRAASQALVRTFGAGIGGRGGFRESLIDMAVYLNTAVTAHFLLREFQKFDSTPPEVVYGVYNIGSLRVRSLPRMVPCESEDGHPPIFAPAPQGADDILVLADRLAKSVAARGLIDVAVGS
jgi:carbonic anhydrase